MNYQEEIYKLVNYNRKQDKFFIKPIKVEDKKGNINEADSFYFYNKRLCIIDSDFMDVAFELYTEETQKRIYTAILNKQYTDK